MTDGPKGFYITPAELQQARREAADRFYEIGMSFVPGSYTYEFRKNLSGWCSGNHIVGPKPVTRRSLAIWLHECAHAHLHWEHGIRKKGKKRHVEEMEAYQWAFARMREYGIPLPRKSTERAKTYVARKIKEAGKNAKIDPAARNFARRK